MKSSETDICDGLVFDNGHRDGVYGNGNWGYEGCAVGNCNSLTFHFVVHTIPENTTEVSCPLSGLNLKFDGEIDTWEHEITCNNSTIEFGGELGRPTLNGTTAVDDESLFEELIFPNPVNDELLFKFETFSAIEYYIRDIYGQLIKRGRIFNNRIDVTLLNSGTYFLELKRNDKITSHKIIKL